MAVGLIFRGAGVTQAQYEQVRDEVSPGGKLVPGCLSHSAGPAEGSWCVVEIWESQEVLERFYKEKLQAALKRAKVDTQPEFFQVTSVFTA